MNGLELVHRARNLAHRSRTPIVVLSATPVEGAAREAGVDVFLHKPQDVSLLVEMITLCLARERVQLTSGGVFDFDAVSADQTIVASISTSGSRTASGNYATGKMMKIRSDILYLLMTNAATQARYTVRNRYV